MSRRVVVGDVHGCARELADLLKVVGLSGDDELVLVGDLVVRGPDPHGVLALVAEHGGRAVRGNHEHRLLRWHALTGVAAAELSDRERRLLDNPWLRATADVIDDEGWALLHALPLWLSLDDPELLVVHAGLVPGVALEAQKEEHLLFLRAIEDDGTPTKARDVGTPWGALYQGPPHVVFGHYAQAQPQLHPWATGLDTGCVYGGALTALVLDDGQPVAAPAERAAQLVSVPAHAVHYPIG
jgi:Calcineurin-like phosphoesterase